jgi:hypothetical protein
LCGNDSAEQVSVEIQSRQCAQESKLRGYYSRHDIVGHVQKSQLCQHAKFGRQATADGSTFVKSKRL